MLGGEGVTRGLADGKGGQRNGCCILAWFLQKAEPETET